MLEEQKEKEEKDISLIMKEIGEKISFSRKKSRKKIDSISKSLRIGSQYLHAIEEGDLKALPSKVYIKGFIRSYAGYFNVDISNELASFDNYFKNLGKKEIEQEQPTNKLFDSLPSQKVFMLTLLIFFIVLYLWNNYKESKDLRFGIFRENDNSISENFNSKGSIELEKNYSVYGVDEKNNSFSSYEENKSNNENYIISKKLSNISQKKNNDNSLEIENELKIIFIDKTWIQIRKVNGSIIESGIFESGQVLFFNKDEENDDFYIDTGNAGGFKLLFGGKELPALGEIGSVKKNISLVEYIKKIEN